VGIPRWRRGGIAVALELGLVPVPDLRAGYFLWPVPMGASLRPLSYHPCKPAASEVQRGPSVLLERPLFSAIEPTDAERAEDRPGDGLVCPATVIMDRGFTVPVLPSRSGPG